MARQLRLCPTGIPQHIIQRGNNRQVCFASSEDMTAYLHWLKQYAQKYSVDVHAWVLMTNHVHLLLTPTTDNGVSLLMQALGRQYVRYFNYQYRRSGTLWEGRFKSCLIQSESYLLYCYRYIELNPVRADMVPHPANYSWSSYQCNALGRQSSLCKPHQEYLNLGKSNTERQIAYRSLFTGHIDEEILADIRISTNKNLTLGNTRFKEEIDELRKQAATMKE